MSIIEGYDEEPFPRGKISRLTFNQAYDIRVYKVFLEIAEKGNKWE